MIKKMLLAIIRRNVRRLFWRTVRTDIGVCIECGHPIKMHTGDTVRCRYPGCWCGVGRDIEERQFIEVAASTPAIGCTARLENSFMAGYSAGQRTRTKVSLHRAEQRGWAKARSKRPSR